MKYRTPFAVPGRVNRNAVRRALVLALSLLLLTVLAWLFREKLEASLSILRDREQLAAKARQLGPVAPLVLGLLLMLQVIIPMIPGQAIVLTCGYLYGPVGGGLLTATALFLSGQIAFATARYAGRPIVYRLASPKALDHWERLAAQRGVIFYACAYTLPFMPSDLLVYVAGLGHLSTRRFTAANILGRLPMGVITAILGAYQLKPPPAFWLIPGLVITLALIGGLHSLLSSELLIFRILARPDSVKLNALKGGCSEKINYAAPCDS